MRIQTARGRARHLLLAGLALACEQLWGIEDTHVDWPSALGGASCSGGASSSAGSSEQLTGGTGGKASAENGGTSGGSAPATGGAKSSAGAGANGVPITGGAPTTGGVVSERGGASTGGAEAGSSASGGDGGAGGSTGGAAGAMGGTTGGTSGGADGGGPAAAGDGGTGGWTPESLAGLMLWLDPSVGVTDANGAVLTWRDRSSVHHLAASDSGFEGPRLDLKTFSGLPVVRFDGVDDRLVVQDAPSLRLGYDDFALALVVSSAPGPDPGDDGRVLFSKQDPTYPFLGLGLMVNAHRFITYVHQQVNIWSPIAGAPQYDDNRIRIVGVHRHGTELDLRVNSAIVGTAQDTDIPNASALGFPIRLGAGHTNQFLHGLIAEVVLSRVDSEEEVMQIDRYLQTKYAAALANASQ